MGKAGADWRKASYSNGQANCVEVGHWRKASYSNGSAQCVEIGHGAGGVLVRDTKQDGRGVVLTLTAGDWRRFTRQLRGM